MSSSIKFKTRVDEFCPPNYKANPVSHHISGIAPAENIMLPTLLRSTRLKEDHEPLRSAIDSSRDGQLNTRNPCCRKYKC